MKLSFHSSLQKIHLVLTVEILLLILQHVVESKILIVKEIAHIVFGRKFETNSLNEVEILQDSKVS